MCSITQPRRSRRHSGWWCPALASGRFSTHPELVSKSMLRVERQHPYARPAFVNRQERPALDVLTMGVDSLGDDADGLIGEQIVSSDLHDARRRSSAGREDCREVQVVRDENEFMLLRPRQ